MIGAVGDLVEDIAVRLHSAVNVASDTGADITRRRGGSAANTAVAVARLGRRARFIGQVGDDAVGTMLTGELIGEGVEAAVRRGGTTGTIVLLIDTSGERTMLADRAACTDLTDPDPAWLDGLQALHVPLYSLVGEPLAATTLALIGWARDRGVQVSIDAASAAVIVERGVARTLADLTAISPDVVLCNGLEATALGGLDALTSIGARATVVKHGPRPATVVTSDGGVTEVEAAPIAAVVDTTGAGDAFAAGFLVAWTDGADAVSAAAAGHASAHDAIIRAT
jgi:sugar/nucleoside kinase (ribokinase family)